MLIRSQAKYIQSLGQKKHRDESRQFIAEGPKAVLELLGEIPLQVKAVYALKEWIEEQHEALKNFNITEVSETELERISHLSSPNKVLAVLDQFEPVTINAKGSITLALDNIQDPGNLGTIIRIADWFGVKQIVCNHECADRYNLKVVQSTMGSLARVNIEYTDLSTWLSGQKEVEVLGATLDGEELKGVVVPGEYILVVGNESKGIDPSLFAYVNKKITIGGRGKAESLNAAVATGIMLFHLR